MEKKLGVNVFGFIGGEFGLGEAVRLIIKALNKAEIPVSLINYDIKTNHRHNDDTFKNLNNEAVHDVNLVLLGPSEGKKILIHYPEDFFKNKYNIFYLNWESEYIPQEYIDNLSFYDEIWVPAQYCKDILAQYLNIPVHVIPYPIEIEVDDEADQEADTFYQKDAFNFFFMFDYNSTLERKNTLNLISAFKKAFEKNDQSVFLTIKTSKSARFTKEREQLESSIKGYQNIKIVEQIYDKQTLHKIIRGCDAYVSLHRSEGFGLTMAEAMFFGKPVIATNYSGNLQFMNADNSFLVDFKKTKIDSSIINYDSNTIWSEPNVDHASELMKMVKENSETVKDLALKGQQTILHDFSVKRIGELVNDTIQHISFEPNLLKNELISLFIESEKMKRDLYVMRKSKLIMLIFNIKMYFRNRKKQK
ncbi:glycosyltransferase family 4 protein [Chryseobacterium sp. Tr-659]|uniref:glycosyltransferase family 4 protein n=1 Tax=Chryseobacterium sp. Tr-659 TaxID=2608340 RepID=UPI00142312B9|nr:glycosyltransferase family 4 protein [Chryseobacterium sp. Tr-659]NIF07909.1 glycosyltransferase family 4 protein [Chryseobacterium sp. Tr-659]